MEEKNPNNNEQKKLFELLKKLTNVQAQNAKLSVAIHAREIKDATKSIVSRLKRNVQDKANKFGTKAQKLAQDYIAEKNGKTEIAEYEAAIAKLESEYNEGIIGVRNAIQDLETREVEESIELNTISQEKRKAIGEYDDIVRAITKAKEEKEALATEKTNIQKAELVEEEKKRISANIEELFEQIKVAKARRKEAIDNDDERSNRREQRKQIRLSRKIKRYKRQITKVESKVNKKIESQITKLDAKIAAVDMRISEMEEQEKLAKAKVLNCTRKFLKTRDNIQKTRGKIKELKAKEESYAVACKDLLDEKNQKELAKQEKEELMPKQNVFQKIAGFFVYKFNGAARFTTEVIGGVKLQTKKLTTETIPSVAKSVADFSLNVGRSVKEGSIGVGQSVKTGTMKAITVVTDKYQETKTTIINKAQESLTKKIESAEAKHEKLEMKRNLQEIIPDEESYL